MIAFEGETSEDLIAALPPENVATIKVGQLGRLLGSIREAQAGYAIMVGQITPRRLFRGLHPDLKALKLLTSLKEKNAESIFGAVSAEIEKEGATVLDARSFLDHELADDGVMACRLPKRSEDHISHGIRIAKECSRLNIGQGVVVRTGTVMAVEAFEGTDEMLRRAGNFKTANMIFVKTARPGQDFRFDVPVFGLKTLEIMRAQGIQVACFEADKTILLEKTRVLECASTWGICILGFT